MTEPEFLILKINATTYASGTWETTFEYLKLGKEIVDANVLQVFGHVAEPKRSPELSEK